MELILLEKSLKNADKKLFDKIPKTDLHNHALLSSNRKNFNKFYPNNKLDKFIKSNNISSLSSFIKNNIINISTTKVGQLNLFECSIITAIEDGIIRLETSIDYRLIFEVYDNNIQEFINDLENLKNKYKNKIELHYDLGISRNAYKNEHQKIIIKLIKTKMFTGIDLFGDELSKPIKIFRKIYRIAKKEKLQLKAHVGEFGSANDIYHAMKVLKLNTIQHGISIVDNKKIMNYAKKKNIQFNICPISNLYLERVSDIKMHPVREMFDFGLNITINTDDQLIFENSLFDEYLLLYKNKIFTIEELNLIRINSLKKH